METGSDGIGVVRSPIFERLRRPCIRFSSWSRPERYAYPEHRHPGKWEFIYIRSGKLIHHVNGVRLPQRRGDFTLIRERDRHSAENIDGEAINISISPQYFDYLCGPCPQPEDLLPRLLSHDGIISGHVPEMDARSVENQLYELLFHQDSEYETVFFCAFFFRLMAKYAALTTPNANQPQTPKWLSDCLTYFDRNPNLPISIDAIQEKCGKTREHISRCFQRHLNTTLSAYINNRRMAMAEKLLLNSDKTAKEIGWEVGYVSNSYFFRIFKQTFGHAPDTHRQRSKI